MEDVIVLHLKTQKGFNDIPVRNNVWDMLLSTCVTYSYNRNEYKLWTHLNQKNLISYLNGNKLVGFNHIRFDLRVLLGKEIEILDDFSVKCDNFSCINSDIFVNIQKALCQVDTFSKLNACLHKSPIEKSVYSLTSIAQATLHTKIDKSKNAQELYRNKMLLELLELNLKDVRIIKQLYEFILKWRYIVNGNYDILAL